MHNYHLVQKFRPDEEKRQKRRSSEATIFLLSAGLQVLRVLGKKSQQSVNTRRGSDSTPGVTPASHRDLAHSFDDTS